MQALVKSTLAGLALLGAVAVPGVASAGHVSVGVGINLGAPGYYEAPAPVYAAPPPAYSYDPPPAVVYAPPPPVVYGPPAPVYGPYYRYPHCWWENGYRLCR